MSKRFQLANLFWWIIIPGGFLITFLLSHYPNVIPFNNLGTVGDFLSYLVLNYRMIIFVTFWSLILLHGYETIVARRICRKLNIDQQSTFLWTIQTFILGYPSLTILKRYVRQRK